MALPDVLRDVCQLADDAVCGVRYSGRKQLMSRKAAVD